MPTLWTAAEWHQYRAYPECRSRLTRTLSDRWTAVTVIPSVGLVWACCAGTDTLRDFDWSLESITSSEEERGGRKESHSLPLSTLLNLNYPWLHYVSNSARVSRSNARCCYNFWAMSQKWKVLTLQLAAHPVSCLLWRERNDFFYWG